MTPKTWPWEVSISTSGAALQRCMRALLLTKSKLTSSYRLGDYPLGRGISAFLMVVVPEGSEEEFRTIAKPEYMKPPSRLQVGTRPLPDDGHPGRTKP